ncbi:hypothetical protein Plhal304r1_c012g0045081 [Plasmopara halstedii]
MTIYMPPNISSKVWIMIQPATFENFELQISTSRKQWKIRNDLQVGNRDALTRLPCADNEKP